MCVCVFTMYLLPACASTDNAHFASLIHVQCMKKLITSVMTTLNCRRPGLYHLNLVELLTLCTEGKNVAMEIRCHSLLPLDELVKVVRHKDYIPEVGALLIMCDTLHFYLQP